jgi:hypothetical protein
MINKRLAEVVIHSLSRVGYSAATISFFLLLLLSHAGFEAFFSSGPSDSVSGEFSLCFSVFSTQAHTASVQEVCGEWHAHGQEYRGHDRECIDPTLHKHSLDHQHFNLSLVEGCIASDD